MLEIVGRLLGTYIPSGSAVLGFGNIVITLSMPSQEEDSITDVRG